MKKLIIMLVGAIATCVASAAAVEWEAYDIMNKADGVAANNCIVYWFDASKYELANATADLNKGDTSFVGTYGIAADELTDSTGFTYGTDISGYDNSQTVNAYLVIFDAATVDSASYAYITGTEQATTGASGQTATIYFESLSGTATASNWIATAAPEPTSGLLLLLGMAGLALRRKCA